MKSLFTLGIILLAISCHSQTWVQKASISNPIGLNAPFSFSINGKLYVGGGYGSVAMSNFYEYDPATNAWTPKASTIIPVYATFAFVLNGKGYIVAGATTSGNIINHVYCYDPVLNAWQQKNDYPGPPNQNGVGFSFNGKGYAFGGFTSGSTVVNTMWEYDAPTDSWTAKANAPGPGRNNPIYLVLNNQVFIGLGATASSNVIYTDFYQFDPIANTYTAKASAPTPRSCAANFSVGGYGYVGLGISPSGSGGGYVYVNDFDRYDPVADSWTQISNFGGIARAHPFSENVGGLPYVGCGDASVGYQYDNWTWDSCRLNINLGDDTALCTGSSIIIGDTISGVTFLWSTGDTTATISVASAGSYWVRVIQGSCMGSDTINISFSNPPAAFNLGSDTTYCGAFSRTLSTGIPSTHWSTGVIASSISVTYPGLYWAQITNSCGSSRDSILISENPIPTVNLGNDTSLCTGNNVILNAGNSGAIYLWQDNSTNQTLTVSTAGTYWANVTVGGCIKRDTILVSYVAPVPAFSIGNDTIYCGPFTRVLSTGVASTMWSTSVIAASITISSPGLYWAQKTNVCGSRRDSILINENPIPTVSLGNDTSLCTGNDVILNAGNGGATYLWQDNSTNQTLTVSTSGTYWVNVTAGGCSKRDSILVSYVSALPPFSIGNDTIYCGPFIRVLSTGVASTLWSTSVTASSITISSPGLYWAQKTNACGSIRDSIVLSENPIPTVNLGNDTIVCQGSNVDLSAGNPGATYLWQDNSTNQTFIATSPGIYWVDVTAGGCVNTDSIRVSYVSPLPPFSIGNDTTYCGPFSRLLYTGVLSTLWSNGNTNSTITVTVPGIFWAQETNACGNLSDSIVITENPLPVVNLGPDTSICPSDSIILDAGNAGASYFWQDHTTLETYMVDSSGLYWVDVTLLGCTSRDSIHILPLIPPMAFSLGTDTTICQDSSIVLNAYQLNTFYHWSSGETTAMIIATQAGLYTVTVTNECGSTTASKSIVTTECTCKVAIPTAFSPNDDGKNDTYGLLTICPVTNYKFDIYDRWGQLMFSSNNVADKWDGRYRGAAQPLGVYTWYVQYTDPYTLQRQAVSGNVTLIR